MSRRKAKIVKELTYTPRGYDPMKIPLRIKDHGDYTHLQSGNIEFCIDIDEPVRVYVSGKNVDEIIKQAFEKLDAHFSIKWDKFIEIEVSTEQHDDAYRRLSIQRTYIEIGTKVDGTYCYRNQGDERSKYVQDGDPREVERSPKAIEKTLAASLAKRLTISGASE